MRSVLLYLALICCAVAAIIGLGFVDFDGTIAEAILRSVGWLGLGAAFYTGSHLIGGRS